MKKVISLFLSLIMVLTMIPLSGFCDIFNFSITASAKDVFNSGFCGDTSDGSNGQNLSWEIDSDGVLTITGNGRMADYVEYEGGMYNHPYNPSSPWYGDLRILSVVFDGDVENVGDFSFLGCENIVSVDFPDNLQKIGKGAFKKCSSLDGVIIPETVCFIDGDISGAGAFAYCSSLSSIVIPEGITQISGSTFTYCTALTDVTLPSTLNSIGVKAFSYCAELSSIDFPNSVTTIDDYAFMWSGLTELELPAGVTVINGFSFGMTKIANIVVPDTVTEIRSGAFSEIRVPIESITLGNNVTIIESGAFTSYSDVVNLNTITEIVIPNSVTTIGNEALYIKSISTAHIGKNITAYNNWFPKDGKLMNIVVDSENPYLHSFDGVLYNSDYSSILWFNKKRTGELTFPKELNIQSLPVNSTENSFVSFSSFAIEDGAQNFSVVDGVLYNKDVTRLVWCPSGRNSPVQLPPTVTTIGSFSMSYTSATVDFSTNNNNLKTIEHLAFRNNNGYRGELVIPEGVETIEGTPFINNYFTSLVLPDSLREIHNNAVYCFYFLKRVHIGANTQFIGATATVNFGDGLEEVTVSEDNPFYASFDGALYSKDMETILCLPSAKQSIHLPAQVKDIPDILNAEQTITVDENNMYFKSDGPLLLSKDGTILYRIQNVENIVIPGTVRSFVNKAGSCQNKKAKSVTFSEGCTNSIVLNALYYTEELSLPGTMKNVIGFGSSNGGQNSAIPLKKVELHEGTECVNAFDNTNITELSLPSTCKYYYIGGKTLGTMNYTGYATVEKLEKLTVLNPDCKFYYIESFAPGGEIHGYCGSTAHKLAVKRQATFVSLGHDYLDWYTVTPATYDAPGVERRDCAYCDHYEEREIPQLVSDTHIATFVADGITVATVEFYSTMTEIEEPEVPAKDRYLGKWEDYTLGNSDITINAVYTLIKSDSAEDINTESGVDYYYDTDDVLFKLKASAAAKTVKTTIYQSVPLDIVLVVDQSGSMADRLGGSQTKLAALKASANSFINQVADNARLTGAAHRIAIVGFGLAGSYQGYTLNENSELLTSSSGAVAYHNITPAVYSSALLNVLDGNAVNSSLTQAVNSIESRGATAADLGLEMAKGIFANTDSTDRQRVVIFMTDGEPTYTNGFQMSVANSAVYNASLLKSIYNASVYSVGVMDTEQRSNPYVDMFMKAVSSDYPNASSFKNLGRRESEHYFITVENTDALSDVFTTISTESLSHTATFDKITFIKTLSKYVTMTSSQEHDMRESLIRHYGISNSDITVTRNNDGTTFIKVSNLSPKEIEKDDGSISYEVSFSFFASLNENAVTAGEYYVDTDDSGVMLDDNSNGYEAVFEPSKVTLESNKTRFVFMINNEVYEITEGSNASEAKPTTEFPSDWDFSNWVASSSSTANGTTINATLVKPDRTITWHTDTDTVVQTYKEGDFITAPAGTDKENGTKFLSWNKSIPTVMPDNDLEFTAIYGDHVHKYTSQITTPATCTAEGVMTYTCICGESYTEQINATGHQFEAITASSDNDSSKCEFVCAHCGEKYEYALNYEIREVNIGRSRLLYEFNLTDENLTTGFEPDGTIYVRIPLSEFQSRAKYVMVVRNNADGSATSVPARIEDGYMIIEADHFSSYEVNLSYNCETLGDHVDADGDGYCDCCAELLDKDVNGDGIIDINDIGFVLMASAGRIEPTNPRYSKADLDCDNIIDAFDAAELDNALYTDGIATGDVNQDGYIDLADYAMAKTHLSGKSEDDNLPANLLDKSYLTAEYDSIKDNYDNGTIITQQYYFADYNADKAVDAFDLFYLDKRLNNIA